MKGIVYLIPAPIVDGENADMVYPLLQSTVNSMDEFIVEDLKTARRSLRQIGFKGEFDKMVFHLLNEHTDVKSIENFLSSVVNGKNIGLMSEAGMPCIADPGSDMVRLAHKKNIRVVPLYGPSSVFLALASSGLNGQNFCFHGYLPKVQNERKKKLKEIEKNILHNNQTQIFMETPYRNNHLLEDILETCSRDTLFCVAMNVTGKSEMILTKTIAEWRSSFSGSPCEGRREELPNLDKHPTVFLIGR